MQSSGIGEIAGQGGVDLSWVAQVQRLVVCDPASVGRKRSGGDLLLGAQRGERLAPGDDLVEVASRASRWARMGLKVLKFSKSTNREKRATWERTSATWSPPAIQVLHGWLHSSVMTTKPSKEAIFSALATVCV